MTESGVQVIVLEAFKDYEEKTGKPRHDENLDNFRELFGTQSELKGAVGAVKTMVLGFGLLFSFIGAVYTVILLVRAVRA